MNEKINFKAKPKKIDCIKKIKNGKNLTIVSSSYSTFEILKLYENLEKKKRKLSFTHVLLPQKNKLLFFLNLVRSESMVPSQVFL